MKAIILAVAALFCAVPAMAERVDFTLRSASDTRSYGIFLTAPHGPCRHVRYRVLAGEESLGQSRPLRPGESGIVRIGKGYFAGDHALQIAAIGCAVLPVDTQIVTLGKASPDHGWRALRRQASPVRPVLTGG